MLPLVSVIMPAYNAEKYIGSAIDSIVNQTYENWELIIVEDCSTDDTLKIIKKYDDLRIRRVENEKNRGIAYSTNRGIDLAKGKYIALIDDDDIATKQRLEIQVEFLEKHTDIDILGGRFNIIDENGNLIRYGDVPRRNPKYIKSILLFKNTGFANGTTMIRKEFIERYALRYQENCYGMQDFKFFIDSSKLGNISALDDLLLYYRNHQNNETNRSITEFEEQRRLKYSEFQRESLRDSGFKLRDDQLLIINKALAEYDGGCDNREELQLLYEAFCDIVRQAREMEVDYCTELEHYCKVRLSEQVKRLICF